MSKIALKFVIHLGILSFDSKKVSSASFANLLIIRSKIKKEYFKFFAETFLKIDLMLFDLLKKC